MSIVELDIKALYYVSLRGYKRQCGTDFTDVKLETHQDKEILYH